jgi:hypothetical protein
MKTIKGLIEFAGEEYDYRAEICDPYKDAWPDHVTDIDRADGKPVPEGVDFEALESLAMENAQLLDWCEREGWEVEDSGGGCSALIRQDGALVRRITRVEDPSTPQTMGEPVRVGLYNAESETPANPGSWVYPGGIDEMLRFE